MIRDDAREMQAIDPLALGRMLRVNGWQKAREDDGWATWLKHVDAGEAEIQVPRDTSARDFTLRLQQAVDTLRLIERWSVDELFISLRAAGSDMIVWRYPQADGRLSLTAAAQAVSAFRELILAGASAAVEPRAVYRTVKPSEAVAYVDEVDLVAPERGSFVLRALSPVPAVMDPQIPIDDSLAEAPFGRRAVEQLYRGVSAAAMAARAVVEEEDSEAFRNAVPLGVSANLCESLHDLASASDDGVPQMTVHFAPVRPNSLFRDRSTTPVIQFGALEIEQIGEAGRVFRQSEPDFDVSVEGIVVRLQHDDPAGQDDGQVTLSAWYQGAMRQIRLTVRADDYRTLIRAHEDKSVVTVQCDIERRGPMFVGSRGRLVSVATAPD